MAMQRQGKREQARDFLAYLESTGDTQQAQTKDTLKLIYNTKFKPLKKEENPLFPINNFSGAMFFLRNTGSVQVEENGNVTFHGPENRPIGRPSQRRRELAKMANGQTSEIGKVSGSENGKGVSKQSSLQEKSEKMSNKKFSARKRKKKKKKPGHVAVDQHLTIKGDLDALLSNITIPPDGTTKELSPLPPGVLLSRTGKMTHFVCEVCGVKVPTRTELAHHLEGRKHRVQVLIFALRSKK